VFVAFLLPFLDIGIMQSPLLNPEPTTLSTFLPGYGGFRVLLGGALTRGFDQPVPLLIGLGWLAALALAVTLTYQRATRPAGVPPVSSELTPDLPRQALRVGSGNGAVTDDPHRSRHAAVGGSAHSTR
jgi:hypothetical protein